MKIKKFILWDKIAPKRLENFSSFPSIFPAFKTYNFILDSMSTSLEDLNQVIDQNSCIWIHLSNYSVYKKELLERIRILNQIHSSLPIILYSGGMQKVNRTDLHNLQFWIEGVQYELQNLQYPENICILPQKIGDDLIRDMNLPQAFEVLEKTGDVQKFFKVMMGEKEALNLFMEFLELFTPLQKMQQKDNDQIAMEKLEKLKVRGDIKGQEYETFKELVREARSGFGNDAEKEHVFYGNLKSFVDIISPALIK